MNAEEEEKIAVHPRPVYAWMILVLSVIFSAYAYILKSTPGLDDLAPESNTHLISIVFALTGYYIANTIFQIPVGILIDRFGARIFPTIGLFICALGSIVLSFVHSYPAMFVAKFVMGAGGTFAFINALKIISNWFQPKRFAFLMGLFIALDTCGIVLMRAFYHLLNGMVGWRDTTLFFGLGGLIFACIFFLVVQDAPGTRFTTHPPAKKEDFWKNIRYIFQSPQIWIIGVSLGLVIGPLFSFETVWSIPFIKQAYKAPFQTAIMFNLLFVFGYASGALYFGRTSTNLQRRKIFLPWGVGFTLLMLLIILYPPYMGVNLTAVCFFVLGFASSTVNLGYVIIHEQNVPQVTATAIATVNTFYALFATVSQLFVAVSVQLGSQVEPSKHATLETFQFALIRLPVYIGISFIFTLFIKETYAKQRYSYDTKEV